MALGLHPFSQAPTGTRGTAPPAGSLQLMRPGACADTYFHLSVPVLVPPLNDCSRPSPLHWGSLGNTCTSSTSFSREGHSPPSRTPNAVRLGPPGPSSPTCAPISSTTSLTLEPVSEHVSARVQDQPVSGWAWCACPAGSSWSSHPPLALLVLSAQF